MGKGKDITGIRFGKLTAVRPTERRQGGAVVWECKCDCGNENIYVRRTSLITGNTQSCGCSKKEDLTGQRFGNLIAIEPTERRQSRSIIWKCRCDCGKEAFVREGHLKYGNTTSCGCAREKGNRREDLTGMRFGKLTAIRSTEERQYGGYVVWECRCDCGNNVFVDSMRLTNGHTKSCGCLREEILDFSKIIIKDWKVANPNSTPKKCAAETGINIATVYRWWNT